MGQPLTGPTGARDAEASAPDDDDVASPEFHFTAQLEASMSEPDAESWVCVASEADAKSERGSRGGAAARRCLDVLGGHRTAPLAHTAEPSLDADRRSLVELVAARTTLDITGRGRSVLVLEALYLHLQKFAMFRGKALAGTTARTRPQVAGGLPKVVHIWTSFCAPSSS